MLSENKSSVNKKSDTKTQLKDCWGKRQFSWILWVNGYSFLQLFPHLSHTVFTILSKMCPLRALWACTILFFFWRLALGVITADHLHSSNYVLVSSSVTLTLCLSCFITSTNLLGWSSSFLLSGSSIFNIICPVYPLCFHCMSKPSQNFIVTFVSECLNFSFPSDILVHNSIHSRHPNDNLSIFISATSCSASCLFVSASVPRPCITACLITMKNSASL